MRVAQQHIHHGRTMQPVLCVSFCQLFFNVHFRMYHNFVWMYQGIQGCTTFQTEHFFFKNYHETSI